MSRPPVSLQTRLIAASAVLAVLVIGVFVAMVLAVSAARTAANQEARSKNVTTSALQLEKARPRPRGRHPRLCLHGQDQVPQALHDGEAAAAYQAKGDLFRATSDEPNQRRQARQINRLIDEYIAVYVDNVPVIGQENLGAARDLAP